MCATYILYAFGMKNTTERPKTRLRLLVNQSVITFKKKLFVCLDKNTYLCNSKLNFGRVKNKV